MDAAGECDRYEGTFPFAALASYSEPTMAPEAVVSHAAAGLTMAADMAQPANVVTWANFCTDQKVGFGSVILVDIKNDSF